MKFSAATGCFYPSEIEYGDLPGDLVDVSREEFEAASNRPATSVIKVIQGRIVVQPGAVATEAEIRVNKIGAIKAERDRRIQSGGFKVGAKWFHSDTFSRTQQMGLVMLGANIPANTPWKTMDGTTVVMTQQLAQQIFAAAAASDIAIFAAAETHRIALEACADPSSYDISAGWPKAFGE
jgi:hypothetical protein